MFTLYQAFIGQITSPICPHCGTGEQTAEHLLLFCREWAAERQGTLVTPLTLQMCLRTVRTLWNSSSLQGVWPLSPLRLWPDWLVMTTTTAIAFGLLGLYVQALLGSTLVS